MRCSTLLIALVVLALPLSVARSQAPAPAALPHLKIDLQNRIVDLEATVIGREFEWLELLACSPGTREHEAVLRVPAKPSHIHQALVMIGLKPGAPMRWWYEGQEVRSEAAHGPKVSVHVLLTREGKQIEVPAHQWIVDKQTGKTPPENHWLFTGSRIEKIDDKELYVADLQGTVLSLVNFNDDLLALPSDKTHMNDAAQWTARAQAIPPRDTQVLLRLRPVAEADEPNK